MFYLLTLLLKDAEIGMQLELGHSLLQ